MINYHQPGARRILELPIYRCKEDQYYKEQEDKFEAEVNATQQSYRTCGAMRHKQFDWDRGKFLEMPVFANQSNVMILEELKKRIHTLEQVLVCGGCILIQVF